VLQVLSSIFAFVESILGGAGTDPEATNIVSQAALLVGVLIMHKGGLAEADVFRK
jgi:hypothetical protein